MSKLLTWQEYDDQVQDQIYRLKIEYLLTRLKEKLKDPTDYHNLRRWGKIVAVYEARYNPDFEITQNVYNLDNKTFQA